LFAAPEVPLSSSDFIILQGVDEAWASIGFQENLQAIDVPLDQVLDPGSRNKFRGHLATFLKDVAEAHVPWTPAQVLTYPSCTKQRS